MTSDADDQRASDLPTWIKSEQVPKVYAIRIQHPELYHQLKLDNASTWKAFTQSKQLIDVPANISEFQKILVTQCLRPDLLLQATEKLVCKLLSLKSMSVARPSLKQLAEETPTSSPILLIATADDADPSKEIQDVLGATNGSDLYVELSLGKGQESQAFSAIEAAITRGAWVCLKNLQLVTDWLPALNQKLESLVEVSPNFRLWLISDTIRSFPEALLQKSNTILYESPSGVKNKVLGLLQKHQPRLSQMKDAKRLKLRVLIFVLNAVLQERRRYLPEGWSRWYDFGDADLDTAMAMTDWLDGAGGGRSPAKVDWTVLRGLCQHLAYGGRLSNQQDVGILITHLTFFLNDQAISSDRWRPLQFQQLKIPQSPNVHDYMSAFVELAEVETPEMLGLAATTNTTRDFLAARDLLKQLRSIICLFIIFFLLHVLTLIQCVGNHFAKSGSKSSIEKRFKPMLSLWKKLVAVSLLSFILCI